MERPTVRPTTLRNVRLKVGALLVLLPLGIAALTVYALYARGSFEPSRSLTLLAQDVDGVDVGMPVTFSGFPIGSVIGMGLADDGEVWIDVSLKERDTRWLRTSSTFSLVRPLMGGATIRVESPRLADPPLPKDMRVRLEVDDTTSELSELVAQSNSVLANMDRMTEAESSLNRSLAQLETVASRMAGDHGMLEGITGRVDSSQKILDSLDRLHALTISMNDVAKHMDEVLTRTDDRVLSDVGVAGEAWRAMATMTTRLNEVHGSILKLDATLDTARSAAADFAYVSKSAREASVDLVALRSQVEDSLHKTQTLLDELNRMWPFARDGKVTLP